MQSRPPQRLEQFLVEHRYVSRHPTDSLEPRRRSSIEAGYEPADLSSSQRDSHNGTDGHRLSFRHHIAETLIDREGRHIGYDTGNQREGQEPAAASASIAATSSASQENCGRPKCPYAEVSL